MIERVNIMMINSAASYNGTMQPTANRLTETQSQQLTEVLSNYDPDALSDDDAKNLVSEIKELGIQPSTGLANALSEVGTNAKDLGEKAGVKEGPHPSGGKKGPPPEGGRGVESVDDALISLISDAVETYETSEESESLWSILETSLEEAGYDTSESLVDFYS
ncbi:hypothetical protein [Parasphingorhabdus sp.]|uniref:hypothetical protein n=1 Tax=Parasphingorhabdus sp. TaxID=2709688 RepID=UPI0032968261